MLFKNIFRKNPKKKNHHGPLNLPEVPADQMNVAGITAILRSGKPIWAWYNILSNPNYAAFKYNAPGYLDGFAVWRLEEDYLFNYIAHFDSEKVMRLRLTFIYRMSNSTILSIIDSSLAQACSVMIDDDHHIEHTRAFVHDVDRAMIESELMDKPVFYVGDEHFYKCEDYPDGLSEELLKKNKRTADVGASTVQ